LSGSVTGTLRVALDPAANVVGNLTVMKINVGDLIPIRIVGAFASENFVNAF